MQETTRKKEVSFRQIYHIWKRKEISPGLNYILVDSGIYLIHGIGWKFRRKKRSFLWMKLCSESGYLEEFSSHEISGGFH